MSKAEKEIRIKVEPMGILELIERITENRTPSLRKREEMCLEVLSSIRKIIPDTQSLESVEVYLLSCGISRGEEDDSFIPLLSEAVHCLEINKRWLTEFLDDIWGDEHSSKLEHLTNLYKRLPGRDKNLIVRLRNILRTFAEEKDYRRKNYEKPACNVLEVSGPAAALLWNVGRKHFEKTGKYIITEQNLVKLFPFLAADTRSNELWEKFLAKNNFMNLPKLTLEDLYSTCRSFHHFFRYHATGAMRFLCAAPNQQTSNDKK